MVRVAIFAVLTLSIAFWSHAASASVVGDAITRDANKLVNGEVGGTWPGEEGYTGNIAAGLVDAYNFTGNPADKSAYKSSAESAAGYFMNLSSLQGDEAYALSRVSAINSTPNANIYRTAVVNYFSNLHNSNGTQGVINTVVNHYTTFFNDQSQAVVYLAYYTVAADTMNAADKTIWRNGLINALGQVDDVDKYPVGALGAAVWALAQTGNGLSAATMVTGTSTVLNNKTLADLPALLAGEIEPSGLKAGSLYWNFGQTDGGYTDDTTMGLMGLEAAYAANPSLNYSSLIVNGQMALTAAIGNDGTTYVDVMQDNPSLNLFGGRALQVLAVPEPASAMLLSIAAVCMIGRRRSRRQG